MITSEQIEELDKKLDNHISQFGSWVGMTLKTLKEKDTIIDERVEQSLNRIDKMEEVIDKVGSAFTPSKANTSTSRSKSPKFISVPKSISTPPTKRNEDLKMISVHPNFINWIKDTIPKSHIVPIIHGCAIEELDVKDDNT